MFGAAECGCLWGCSASSRGLSSKQGPEKSAQTKWRSEAPQQLPSPICAVLPCENMALPATGVSLHRQISPWQKAASSVLHISTEPGPSFWQGCRSSIFTAGSLPSLLLAVSGRLISLQLNRISRHRHCETQTRLN